MSKFIKKSFLILFLVIFLNIPAFAQGKTKEPIVVKGDRVEYLYDQKKVVGFDNINITYKDIKLICDKIEVDMEKRVGVAEGNVALIQGTSIFRGEKVSYDFDAGKGTIIEAEIRSKPWYGKGEAAHKVSDNGYLVRKSYLSTCELDPPHYRIQAKEIRIYLGDRIEAKHVTAYVGKIPVFYFPYYHHPLDDNRPRVTIVPGRDDEWGYYALTAWRYYFHEWSRGYIHLDWREKKGFAGGIDYKYKAGYFGKGLARFYYADEGDHLVTDEEVVENFDTEDNRWRTHIRHKWNIDSDTLAMGEYHKLSDPLFLKDYFYNEEYEKLNQPETYLSVIRTKSDYVLSAFMRKRINNSFTVVENLPELKLDIKDQRLSPERSFYYNSTTTMSNLAKKWNDDTEEKLKANRFDTRQEFSYPFKLWGALNLNPYLGGRFTWYSEDALDHKNEYRYMPTAGIENSIRFSKIFPYETDFLNLDINGLRHLVQPSLNYSYTPTPNLKATDLKQFDSIDNLRRDHRVILQLENKLQTKRHSNEEIFDLARFVIRTDFLVDMKDPDGLNIDTQDNVSRLSDFDFDLEIKPYSWLFFKSSSRWDYTRGKFESFNTDLVSSQGDKWSFNFGHRYEDSPYLGVTNQFVTETAYKISPKWDFSMYHRLKKDHDSSDYKLEEQSYSIGRDLHCWLAEITYNIRKHTNIGSETENDHRIWLVMKLKAFPDLPVKLFSASYSKPRPGSRDQIPY